MTTGVQYSFVVPIYHDADLAHSFTKSFATTFHEFLGNAELEGHVELIFVSDDGTPGTSETLRSVCDQYPFASFIELSRNFGQHVALSCGYRHASGEFVGMLNVDQEDPTDQIPVLIEELKRTGAEMAMSVRASTEGTNPKRRYTSRFFNWFLNKATGYSTPLNAGTLRIMTRPTVDKMNALEERSRFLPGLEAWFGFRTVYVPITQQARSGGSSSYNLRRRLRMAFEAIISFSDLPLRWAVMLGTFIAVVGILLSAFLIVSQAFFIDFQPGYTSTLAAIVLVGGIQIIVIGVASLYIGRILSEVQRRPLYVIRQSYNLRDTNDPTIQGGL